MKVKYDKCEKCIYCEMQYEVYEVSNCILNQNIEEFNCDKFEEQDEM